MEQYIKEFNNLNHTNFKLKDIYCLKCKVIYGCKCKTPLLEEILNGAQFPCTFEKCNFKGHLPDYQKHTTECEFGTIKCPLDDALMNSIDELLEHLPEHIEVQKITLEALTTTIKLVNKLQHILLAEYKTNYFMVFIKKMDDYVSFQVGKHLTVPCPTIKIFTVEHVYEKMNIHQDEEMMPLSTLLQLKDEETTPRIIIKKAFLKEDSEIKIHFSDYENTKSKMIECEVCFNSLNGGIRWCLSYHPFCCACASKMNSCPKCRLQLGSSNLDLKYILANYEFPCENAEEGCLQLLKSKDITEHNKKCGFRKIKCGHCNQEFRAHTFTKHFINMHELRQNFSQFTSTFTNQYTSAVYVYYRSKIFCLNINYRSPNLEFVVELLNDFENVANTFKYEVLLLHDNRSVAKCGNVCVSEVIGNGPIKTNDPPKLHQTNAFVFKSAGLIGNCPALPTPPSTSTTGKFIIYNSSINLDPCQKYFLTGTTLWTVNCQFNILFN